MRMAALRLGAAISLMPAMILRSAPQRADPVKSQSAVAMMLARLRVVTHFVMRRMIGIHVLELAMRTGADIMAYASGVPLRAGGDKAAITVMTVLRRKGAGRRETNGCKCAQTDQHARHCFFPEHLSFSPVLWLMALRS